MINLHDFKQLSQVLSTDSSFEFAFGKSKINFIFNKVMDLITIYRACIIHDLNCFKIKV